MDQIVDVPVEVLMALIDMAKRFHRPVTIDWTNRTIRVLSPELIRNDVVLSTGPMKYREILAHLP